MLIKPVYLSSQSNVTFYQSKYNVDQYVILHGKFLFELSGCTTEQINLLFSIGKSERNVLAVHENRELNQVLLQFSEINRSLRKIRGFVSRDQELVNFFNRVETYFYHSKQTVWKLKNSRLDFSQSPFIMGILNVTPDSFSDGGKFESSNKAIDHALFMVEAGADIIDVGGESTRPGSDPVKTEDELKRVIPVIEGIKRHTGIPLSIDTYKSEVAEAALISGADIVNDISGCTFDAHTIDVVKKYNVPVIIMHIKGTPKNMQQNPVYEDVFPEVYNFLEGQVEMLKENGIENVAIDPGIGFGKQLNDNLKLLNNLEGFKFLSKPLLIGVSRKSLIGHILNKNVNERLIGSLSIALLSAVNGADILRVHDVAETKDVFKILEIIRSAV